MPLVIGSVTGIVMFPTVCVRTFYPARSVGAPLNLRRRRYGLRRLQGVVEEHGAGHRADAAGHG